MARHPGTPVGDLFPPGVAIFGAGSGQGQQALPPASSHPNQGLSYFLQQCASVSLQAEQVLVHLLGYDDLHHRSLPVVAGNRLHHDLAKLFQ